MTRTTSDGSWVTKGHGHTYAHDPAVSSERPHCHIIAQEMVRSRKHTRMISHLRSSCSFSECKIHKNTTVIIALQYG